MPIMKRRLDICGRERDWEYLVESAGHEYRVRARQIGRADPRFTCSCGAVLDESEESEGDFSAETFGAPCIHIAEAERDLSIARQAAAQMLQ